MKPMRIFLCLTLIAFLLSACATSKGHKPENKRQAINEMQRETLAELYQVRPQAKSQIASSPGYAVFSNANVNVIFASFGGGYGVVQSNRSPQRTYMKMGELGIGLGLGLKDFRAVFIFHDDETMQRFIESGWEFGGHADAAAKASDMGAAVGGEALLDNITIYQLTESGLALQATVKGTKYWKDEALNAAR
ncbi:MAG: YSC84-related protein [Desulfobacterales bacterium]|nr:YSC84-related protein [Desulfobacterales bacterium]MDJ0874630.1 YSC84-related protein [Desulfobacterales bacterium]